MDLVSLFVTSVRSSLRVGTVRNCKFSIPFQTDVFHFLFNGKGTVIHGRRGRSYTEADFDLEFFPSNWYISYSKLGDGCKIVFPIFLYSYVKYAPQTYHKTSTGLVPLSRDFIETLTVTVCKSRC